MGILAIREMFLNSISSSFRLQIAMSKGLKKGGEWENQVVFDPNVESDTAYIIDDDSLIDGMSELIDSSEMILQIWVYKKPLSHWQLTQLYFNHQFVVLETSSWWWSIEKDGQNIVIRRSRIMIKTDPE